MLEQLFQEIVLALERERIPYMISGSLAMNAYTVPRMTRDIDIVIDIQMEDVKNFLTIFNNNFYINSQTVAEEISRRGMFNAIDHRSGYKIDFVVKKNIAYRKLEFVRRRKAKVMNVDAWLVSPEDLIISKFIWIQQIQSDKQAEDIRNLLANVSIDIGYVKSWIKELNLMTFDLIQ